MFHCTDGPHFSYTFIVGLFPHLGRCEWPIYSLYIYLPLTFSLPTISVPVCPGVPAPEASAQEVPGSQVWMQEALGRVSVRLPKASRYRALWGRGAAQPRDM